MENILITGSNGFIGKNLNEALKNNYNVFAMSHSKLDLLDEDKVKQFIAHNKIDIIIHCAVSNEIDKNGKKMINHNKVKDNLKMFFNLEKCLNKEMVMINCGSGAEYDKRRALHKIREDDFGDKIPDEDYAFSKYMISKFIADSNKNIINLRIFGLYGKYENYKFKFISNAIVKNLLHLPIVINQNVLFDYLYIDDFVTIVNELLKRKLKKGTFNITPTEPIDLISICNNINNISNFKSQIQIINDGFNKEYTGDNTKILRYIDGFDFTFTAYIDGIKSLYDYYKSIYNDIEVKEIEEDKYFKFVNKSNS